MAILGEWLRRLGYLLRRRKHDEDLRRELEAHRAMLDDPRAFGNALQLREEARDAWGWAWFDDFVLDTRVALRTVVRAPLFALTAVATLALGIGVNVGMFAVVNAMLLRSPYDGPNEIVGLYTRSTSPTGESPPLSYQAYRELRDGTTSAFEHLAAYVTGFVGVHAGAGASRVMADAVSANYFQTINPALSLGRGFTADEEVPGRTSRVVVVSYRFWEQQGFDPSVLGRIVRVNGAPFTIVGVAPRGFTGTNVPGPDLWLPLGEAAVFDPEASAGGSSAMDLSVIGRLRAGQTIESAAAVVTLAGRRLTMPLSADNAAYTLELAPPSWLPMFPGARRNVLAATIAALLMAMPLIVLVVACLNLANLLLARGVGRQQEMAIRSSLGAGRWRLTRQLLTEGLLLALAGGVAGMVMSSWATDALLASLRPLIPVAIGFPELSTDRQIVFATIVFSVIATLLFGAAPALAVSRRALATDLKDRRALNQPQRLGRARLGSLFVVAQVALSLVLLASGGLFVTSAIAAATADPGFRLDRGVVADIDSGLIGYSESRARDLHRTLVERLGAIAGVESVTIGSGLPFSSFGDSRSVAAVGSRAQSGPVDAVFLAVGRDYARTLGLPPLAGRDFDAAELEPGRDPVAIVDDELARTLWPGQSPLGESIRFDDASGAEVGRVMRIVGVVPAVKHSLGNPRPFPHVYVPLGQHHQSAMTLQVRLAAGVSESAMRAAIAGGIRAVDGQLPILRVRTWREHLDGSLDVWIYRAGARVFATFGGIALLLAVVGVYGVKSYVVSRQTREFGIRLAVGAEPRTLLWEVLRSGARATIAGVGIGLLLALGVGQLLRGFLYGISGVEPVVLVAAPLILLASSMIASYVPALRATKVDPTVALRSE